MFESDAPKNIFVFHHFGCDWLNELNSIGAQLSLNNHFIIVCILCRLLLFACKNIFAFGWMWFKYKLINYRLIDWRKIDFREFSWWIFQQGKLTYLFFLSGHIFFSKEMTNFSKEINKETEYRKVYNKKQKARK